MSDKVIYVMYDDDGVLKDGAKKLVSKGVKIADTFSPFPIHGIDPIIGVKNTRLGIMAFLYGLTGLTLATIGMRFFMIEDWPMNIGGKPSFSYLENTVCDKRYPAIAAAAKVSPFLNNGNTSLVLEIIGAKPKMPNSIPHKGERRAKNPIDMI